MRAVQEMTKWEGDIQPNHKYLLDGDKMLAFLPAGSKTATYFKKPIVISRRGRVFVDLKKNPFEVPADAQSLVLIKVEGSKGAIYWVNPQNKSCTCPGFTYRGACKHVKDL